jgi:hypothetical protein
MCLPKFVELINRCMTKARASKINIQDSERGGDSRDIGSETKLGHGCIVIQGRFMRAALGEEGAYRRGMGRFGRRKRYVDRGAAARSRRHGGVVGCRRRRWEGQRGLARPEPFGCVSGWPGSIKWLQAESILDPGTISLF